MLTAQQYIDLKPTALWIHNLDLLEHVLKADPKATAYKGEFPPSMQAHRIFVEEIEKASPKGIYRHIEEGFNRRNATVEVPSTQGSLNIDRYLAKDELCFDEPVKRFKPRLSRTIIFDAGKNQHERYGKDCEIRHEKVYAQAVRCEENGEPCRVVAAVCHRYSEVLQKYYIVVKDYNDPIFPAIWACIKTNTASWALNNALADFMAGTNDSDNGSSKDFRIGDDIPPEEDVQIIDPLKIER